VSGKPGNRNRIFVNLLFMRIECCYGNGLAACRHCFDGVLQFARQVEGFWRSFVITP
jgi:hypothetical protein